MKNNFFSIFVLGLVLVGCGSGSAPSETAVGGGTTTEAERGPVFNAKVVDAKGDIGIEEGNTNKYKFYFTPTYPLTVQASNDSWIDIDGDGKKTTKDVVLDVNMTSYVNVITPITTVLSDENKTKREALAKKLSEKFNIPINDLYKVPSKANDSNLSILTNVIYKKAKELNKSIKALFNYKTLVTDSNTTLENSFTSLENKVKGNSSLYKNGVIDSLKLEKYLYDNNNSLFTKYKIPDELAKRVVNATDSIEDIWNIDFDINNNSYNNIKIGVEIIKYNTDGTIRSRGQFVFSGVDISSSSATSKRIDIWAITSSSSGGTWIDGDSRHSHLLDDSLDVNSGKLTLKIGTLIKELTDSESSFKTKTKYGITIISTENIFKKSSTKTLGLIDGDYNFVNKQGMSGEIEIK
jgi:hypothetical protein